MDVEFASNLTALTANYAINFLIPLITTPFLIHKVGIERLGLIGLSQTAMLYLNILIDYGFNITATKQISVNRDNKTVISQIFSSALTIKIMMLLPCFLIGLALVSWYPVFKAEQTIFWYSSLILIGQALMPVWLFQGLNQMKYVAYFNVFFKSIYLILLFFFIQSQEDYIFVNLLFGMSVLLVSISSLLTAHWGLNVKFRQPSKSMIWQQLTEAWPIFLSNILIGCYNYNNIFFLGHFANATTVGVYTVAERVVGALRQVIGVFWQAGHPQASRLAEEDSRMLVLSVRKKYILFGVVIAVACSCIFIFAPTIILWLAPNVSEAVYVLQKMSVVPFIVLLAFPPLQVLLAANKNKEYQRVFWVAFFVNTAFNFLLVSVLQINGTILTVILTELAVVIGFYYYTEFKFKEYSFF